MGNEPSSDQFNDSGFKPDASILLHPPIPTPLHGTNPRTVMGTKWWNEQRRRAYEENNFVCSACGVHKEDSLGREVLEAHEYYHYDYVKYKLTLAKIVALCPACHAYIHVNRMNRLFDKGELTEFDCWEITAHGERTLHNQGYIDLRVDYPSYCDDDWDKWHIVIDGKVYYSRFKNRDEWKEYYK